MEDQRFIDGRNRERQHTQDLASILADHLHLSGRPDADTWGDAIEWFRQRIKGGQLSVLVQQEFDARFGAVDWSAFAAVSPQPDTGKD